LFCFIGCLLTGFMSIYGLPWGRLSTKALTLKIAASNLDMGLKEKTFNECFKGVMLYINKIDLKDKSLIDVFIEDKRSENIVSTIIAPKGKMFSEPDKLAFHLRLYDGTINQVALERKSVHSVHFDTYDINLNLAKAISVAKGEQKHKKEMSLAELHRFAKTADRKDAQYYSMLIEFHKKFSIPFACFALGLLAVPLGMVSSSAKRSFGLGLGLISILLYYLLLSAGKVFGETGIYPPAIGMWVPNIFIGGIGVFVLVRTGKERPLRIDVVPDWVKRIISRFSVH